MKKKPEHVKKSPLPRPSPKPYTGKFTGRTDLPQNFRENQDEFSQTVADNLNRNVMADNQTK